MIFLFSTPARSAGPPVSWALRVAALLTIFCAQASLAQNQFQRGMTWEDNRYNALPLRYSNNVALPPARSLKAYYPKVVIQPKGDYTGVAWAAVWNARTAAEAIACNQTDPLKIREIAFAPAYNYGLVRKTADCNEPISMIDLLESLVKNGTPYFSEFAEFCPSEVPADLYPLARDKKLSGYFKLFHTTDIQNTKVQAVKSALVGNSAVIAGMVCPPSFQLAQEFWQPRESQPDPQYGGHAICVVGYDDTKFGGAFEVLNTWGKDWAKQGFTWIRYKDFSDYVPYSFALFQVGSASCNLPFEGNISFKLLNGEEMRVLPEGGAGQYKFSKTYPSGTTFMMQMSSNMPGYVYSFGVDPGNSFFPLFPRLAQTMPITFASLRAPDDMPAITLTDPPGKNNIYFIFSPAELDLAKCMGNLKGRKVITPTDVQSALPGNTALPVKWSEKGLSFTGPLTGPVVIQVTLDQTRK